MLLAQEKTHNMLSLLVMQSKLSCNQHCINQNKIKLEISSLLTTTVDTWKPSRWGSTWASASDAVGMSNFSGLFTLVPIQRWWCYDRHCHCCGSSLFRVPMKLSKPCHIILLYLKRIWIINLFSPAKSFTRDDHVSTMKTWWIEVETRSVYKLVS